MATDGEDFFYKCKACHGVNAEKNALGVSQVIAGWPSDKIQAALKGFRDGTYGGPMKQIMKGQVKSILKNDDENIKAVAAYVSSIK